MRWLATAPLSALVIRRISARPILPRAGAGRSLPTTMFAWAPIPEAFRAMGSLAFSRMLLREAGVAVSPGIGFGEHGEGFVRLGLVENEQRVRQAARGVKRLLAEAEGALSRHAEADARAAAAE